MIFQRARNRIMYVYHRLMINSNNCAYNLLQTNGISINQVISELLCAVHYDTATVQRRR